MSDYTPTTEVIRHALAFPRERLGEPRPIKPEAFDRWLEQVKSEAKANVLARPLPSREEIARTLDQTGAFCGTCSYEPGDFYNNCDDCRRVLDSYADAVLALLKGQNND